MNVRAPGSVAAATPEEEGNKDNKERADTADYAAYNGAYRRIRCGCSDRGW